MWDAAPSPPLLAPWPALGLCPLGYWQPSLACGLGQDAPLHPPPTFLPQSGMEIEEEGSVGPVLDAH